MNITIIVPTHMDRTHYLKRMLSFYSTQNFSGKILIGDSSEKSALSNNKKLLSVYKNIDIRHIYYPKSKFTNNGKLSTDIIKYVDTDYVCFSGDDDFQIPETLSVCIDFLRYNADYIGAHGCKIKYELSLEEEANRIKVGNVDYVRGQYLDIEDPVFRFRSYMKSESSPQYHVMRKSTWEEMYKHSFKLPDSYFLVSEVLPCSLYYILGRVKRFDDIVQYMMEQTPVSYQVEHPDYVMRGINSKGWGECATAIREIIVNSLIEKGVVREAAEYAFDEEYNFRMLRQFNMQFQAKYGESFEEFNKTYQTHTNKYDQGFSLAEATLKDSMAMISTHIVDFINENNK